MIDDTGGMFAFRQHYWGYGLIDNLTIESDRTGGVGGIPDGTLDTTDLVDDFAETSGVATIEPTHDAAGNLTFDGQHAYTYDAWNRLITVSGAYRDPTAGTVQTGHTTATYRYDGLNRRIVRTLATIDGDATYHDYYRGWSLIETRDGSDTLLRHVVWGLNYIDEMIANVLTDDDTHDFAEADARVTYATHDQLFNVLGIFDEDGAGAWSIAERYEYTPYGERQAYVSAGDDDLDAQAARLRGLRSEASLSHAAVPLNPFGFQGLRHDEAHGGGLVQQRERMTLPRYGRFMQRDPARYIDGANLMASYFILNQTWDPFGLHGGTEVDPEEPIPFVEDPEDVNDPGWADLSIKIQHNGVPRDEVRERCERYCDSLPFGDEEDAIVRRTDDSMSFTVRTGDVIDEDLWGHRLYKEELGWLKIFQAARQVLDVYRYDTYRLVTVWFRRYNCICDNCPFGTRNLLGVNFWAIDRQRDIGNSRVIKELWRQYFDSSVQLDIDGIIDEVMSGAIP